MIVRDAFLQTKRDACMRKFGQILYGQELLDCLLALESYVDPGNLDAYYEELTRKK